MLIAFLVLLGVAAIGWAIAIFLGTEFLKRFQFMWDFLRSSNVLVNHFYRGSEQEGHQPGMRNIVLRSLTSKQFSVLVGFRLRIPILGYEGFDYYGFVRSDSQGVAVVSTYMGRGACEFVFFVNADLASNPITVTSNGADQALTPGGIYPPHWYQELGFYG